MIEFKQGQKFFIKNTKYFSNHMKLVKTETAIQQNSFFLSQKPEVYLIMQV